MTLPAPSPLRALGSGLPVAGGEDVDLPGRASPQGPVRLRGTRWRLHGAGGPPVLLLHGLASTRRFWDLVVPRLVHAAGSSSEVRPSEVVALDQRGHGDSDQPSTGYGADDLVADVAAVLDALGWAQAVVVGHSWGAWTALGVAAAHPERCAAVVAVDGGLARPGDDGTPRDEVRRRMEPPQRALPPEDVEGALRSGPLGPWWTPAHAEALLPIFGVGSDGLARARLPFALHMQVVDALLDVDPEHLLPRVSCPAWLVVCGPPDAGGAHPALARAASVLAEPRPMRWGGALHDVPLQYPALVAGLLEAATAEVAGAPRGGPTS